MKTFTGNTINFFFEILLEILNSLKYRDKTDFYRKISHLFTSQHDKNLVESFIVKHRYRIN